MKPSVQMNYLSGSALQVRKDAARRKDMADFRAGVSGDIIARRNGCVPIESVRKARIVFA